MIFDLSSFLGGKDNAYHLQGNLEIEDLLKGSNIIIQSPIKYDGDIFKLDGEYHIHITIWYTYEGKCDRCLTTTTEDITTVLSGRLKEFDGKFNNEDELDEIIYYENNLLNLKENIWSQVVSSLPMKILCSDGCKGLCSTCGVDLNTQSCNCKGNTIDPRLEKLMELFPKK